MIEQIGLVKMYRAKYYRKTIYKMLTEVISGFPGGTVVKNPPAKAGDTGSSPGPERSHMLRSN